MAYVVDDAAYTRRIKEKILTATRSKFHRETPDAAEILAYLRDAAERNEFCNSLLDAYQTWGKLSERQLQAARDSKQRSEERLQQWLEQRAKEAAEADPVPDTDQRIVVQGEVLSIKETVNRYGYAVKMTIKCKGGYRLYGTCPSALESCVSKGDTVRFEAKVKRSDDSHAFGFFSRPTKAHLIEVAA